MNEQIINQNNEQYSRTINFNIEKAILTYESMRPTIEKMIIASNKIFESIISN